MGFQFRHAYYLYLLLAVFPLGALLYWLVELRRRNLIHLMGAQAEQYASRSVKYHRLRAALLLAAAALAVIALARPQWGQHQDVVQTQGIDVIIAVDVSLSMLADDESPSRLARARRLSADLVERLHENRIGLIAFAGSGAALMPLTLDAAALKTFVDALSLRVVDDPGSAIDQAIRRAVQSFQNVGKQSRVLILLSDGEDQSDDPIGSVRDAAAAAADNGIMIVAIGIGTTKGANIPLDAVGAIGFKQDSEGKTVVTKLEEEVLQAAAEATKGIYIRSRPEGDEDEVVADFVDRLNKGEFRDRLVRDREDRYQYPLAAAAILLLIDMLLMLRKR